MLGAAILRMEKNRTNLTSKSITKQQDTLKHHSEQMGSSAMILCGITITVIGPQQWTQMHFHTQFGSLQGGMLLCN